MEIESYQHSNMEEAEMAQLHADHINSNAIAAVRSKIPKGPSLSECADCGDLIPVARQLASPGCQCCIYCQTARELRK